ncbi:MULTISPECIES: sigma-70 family RNA polymerase sigma factor [unclassified Amycolatopsis]|uniref:sigma-70 family RNA polymerase sigma factor n=1 Tax=unclassified Amycolatopsis TaxID=2618356 RepID=UPI002E139499|nr:MULTISPECIES: sigma-70 family RNA polymerase sigma factor [unclassified Amycolatopsis]WSJ79525.1 sigma-70 family RNA polymerase sigma factor [Amycolatopsis sp. NBC_01307]WSK76988.1 sigma-70 family RNA polymerase sigma factor [Amycolatopsis sp. NBC_01286]
MNSSRDRDDERITALALAAARGDQRAYADWVRSTQADVWRFVAHLTDSVIADDLTQETYARAVTSLTRFAGRSSSRTWLLSIARRAVVDHFRARSARPRLSGQDWTAAAEEQSARSRADSAGFEEVVEVGLLLRDLDGERREALVLTQLLGYTYAEAAEICGCPIGTVRSRVARAREDLLTARDERGNVI